LDGALALAVPTKKGQNLLVKEILEPKIYWKSFDEKNNIWFERIFQLPIVIRKSDPNIVQMLKNIFLKSQYLQPDFLSKSTGFEVETHLDFPRNWGLGSSSTLINNVAQWAKVNPYQLLEQTLGGSGYDIACANNNTPIFYQLIAKQPIVTPVVFNPHFSEQLYFVYLNQKQRSSREIKAYQSTSVAFKKEIILLASEISQLTLKVTCIEDFEILLNEHEKILANVLKRNPIQSHFKDYFGQLKSLGAWGGDFILATGNDDTPYYFKKKGFETVISYKDMVL
jgi:mevalonate kinase